MARFEFKYGTPDWEQMSVKRRREHLRRARNPKKNKAIRRVRPYYPEKPAPEYPPLQEGLKRCHDEMFGRSE